jgi:hypothetical protein
MNKLAIVGSGPDTRDLAPWNDETFDIWVLNEAPMAEWCKRWTASFQLHSEDIYTGYNTKGEGYWDWLQIKHDLPVFMKQYDSRVPDCEVLPLNDLIELTGEKYFGITPCYIMGLAILKGYEHIEVWGVELSATEYMFGADSWRYWVGFAKGRLGKENVILRSGNQLFQCPLYGYEGGFSIGREYFEDRAKYLDGSWTASEKHLRNLKRNIERMIEKKEYDKAKETIQEYEDIAVYTGQLAGALSESERLAAFADQPADRHEFEKTAAKSQREGVNYQTLQNRTSGMVEYIWNAWKQSNGSDLAATQLLNMVSKLGKQAYETGNQSGVFTESMGYKEEFDKRNLAIGRITNAEPYAKVEMVK